MLQPYVMAYYIPLFLLWSFAIAARDKDYTFITSISIIAFIATRLITFLPEGDRIMLDFANDLVVCAVLIYLPKRKTGKILKTNKIIPYLVITYIAMMISYIFYIAEAVTNTSKTYMLEAISVIQLLLIFGGLIYGISRHYKYRDDNSDNLATLVRDRVDKNNAQGVARKEADIPFKSGTHASLAKDN